MSRYDMNGSKQNSKVHVLHFLRWPRTRNHLSWNLVLDLRNKPEQLKSQFGFACFLRGLWVTVSGSFVLKTPEVQRCNVFRVGKPVGFGSSAGWRRALPWWVPEHSFQNYRDCQWNCGTRGRLGGGDLEKDQRIWIGEQTTSNQTRWQGQGSWHATRVTFSELFNNSRSWKGRGFSGFVRFCFAFSGVVPLYGNVSWLLSKPSCQEFLASCQDLPSFQGPIHRCSHRWPMRKSWKPHPRISWRPWNERNPGLF